MRMHPRRFTRLTNAFSKIENHAHSVAMFAMYYNFVRIHKTLRTTPAMAAGITSRLWEIGDIVGVLRLGRIQPSGGEDASHLARRAIRSKRAAIHGDSAYLARAAQ